MENRGGEGRGGTQKGIEISQRKGEEDSETGETGKEEEEES